MTNSNKSTKAADAAKKPVKAKPAKKATIVAKPKAASVPAADKAAARAELAAQLAADTRLAGQLFNAFDAASISVPVKPMSVFKKSYQRTLTAHPVGRKPTPRQAAAIAVAALANGKTIKNNVKFSRKFKRGDAEFAIENGALRDAIASGLVDYDGESETLTIRSAAAIAEQIGTVTKLAV